MTRNIKIKKNIFSHRFFFLLLGIGFLCIAAFAVWIIALDIPDVSLFTERKVEQSTKIYDRTGTILLYDVHGSVQRTVIPFDEIPRHVKNAAVAIEDANFYNHHGISIEGIARAFFSNLISGDIAGQGGSTITQQLIKSALLTTKKTITRKIKEAILAIKLERVLSKEEILNLYLNEIPYGGQSYGIEAASQTYFAKSARDLTLAESAYLAALPQAPTYYSPYGLHTNELEKRKNTVLTRMNELGFIVKEEAESAMREKVLFIPRADESLKAPHFVMYVIDQLQQRYGKDVVDSGGLKVITSLDWDLQQKGEELTKRFVEEEKDKFLVSNAGLVALEPKTGLILVMVGSKDFWGDPEPKGCAPGATCQFDPQVNVTIRLRQPGSSFKPIVYAQAFKEGYTPETVVFDLPTEFNHSCNPDIAANEYNENSKCYAPQNYDSMFRGPVTFREALAQSINVPSVKVLYLAGLRDSIALAKTVGITTLTDPDRYGLTLVLGGGEVKLLEMASAYAVFANDGTQNPPTAILKAEENDGTVLEEYTPPHSAVLDPEIARRINSVLSDNNARAPAFGEQSYLYFPDRQVAAKTGTTNDYRDAWVIGYTPAIAVGVWFGNNDNTPMEKKVAGFIAAPLWNAFLKEALQKTPNENFTEPSPEPTAKPVLAGEWRGSLTYTIDSVSGKRATEYTPIEFRKEKPLIQIHEILHWVDKDNPRGAIPSRPENDPQYALWEYAVRAWANAKHLREETVDDIPKEFDDVHMPLYTPSLSFASPPPQKIIPNQTITFSLSIESRFPIKQIDVLIGNTFLGSSMQNQQNTLYTIEREIPLLDIKGNANLFVRVYDSVGNSNSIDSPIIVCLFEENREICD